MCSKQDEDLKLSKLQLFINLCDRGEAYKFDKQNENTMSVVHGPTLLSSDLILNFTCSANIKAPEGIVRP